MATGISSRSFISVLKRSGVVSEEELNRALAAIQEGGQLNSDDPQSLAKAMIANGVITRWQAEKLLQGKHKGFFLGPYRLLDMLGRGGMGAVYLAEHTLMRRRCAIKILPTKNIGSRSYLERFYREAQAVAAMDHKNIVRAYDVNQAKVGDADVHFLAMEFVEGRDLQRLVDESGTLAYSQAAEYVRQAAEGLAHAHEVNMVHRDIKPANLLVNSKGVVKILDLGLAKFYDNQQEAASLTVAHNETVLGTADYLAPEQAVDSHNTDHRADIYSLGCTFYFLLTGHPPFCEGSVANRLLHHQMKAPPSIREDRHDAPENLLVIIDRMMAKKREERYQSAKDVADDLAVWLVENGNEEWRERNPELVHKVGESWRADTKVVSGSLVDTAELDLKADEDLMLAPLEGAETPKESPLVAGEAAALDSGLDLDLAPHDEQRVPKSDAGSKAGSGVKGGSGVVKGGSGVKSGSGIKSATTAPVEQTPLVGLEPIGPADLQPLAGPDLVSLDDLQSIDVGAPGAGLGTADSALSSGLGLTQPATHVSGPHAAVKKHDDSFPIPMPWIIAIAAIAVVLVLAVLMMMIFGGGDDTAAIAPGQPPAYPAPQHAADSQPAAAAPPVEPSPPSDAETSSVSPAPSAPSETNPPQQPAPAPSDQSPKTADESAQPAEIASAPPAQSVPSDTAQAASPATSASDTAPPAPARIEAAVPVPFSATQSQTQASAPAPAEATPATPTEVPASQQVDRQTAKDLWAKIDTISLDVVVPPLLSKQSTGLQKAVEEKLSKFKIDQDAPAVLQVNYGVEAPKDRSAAIQYTVAIKLTVTDSAGQELEIWTEEKRAEAQMGGIVDAMRNDASRLVTKMINTLGR